MGSLTAICLDGFDLVVSKNVIVPEVKSVFIVSAVSPSNCVVAIGFMRPSTTILRMRIIATSAAARVA